MKRLITILLILLASISQGQNVCSFSPEYDNTLFCLSGYSSYNDNISANKVVEDVLLKINLKNSYFVTKVCRGINNAMAYKQNGVNYILLDVDWMKSLKYGKNDWFHLFVIGHEMGHHLLKHTEKETISLQESRKNRRYYTAIKRKMRISTVTNPHFSPYEKHYLTNFGSCAGRLKVFPF